MPYIGTNDFLRIISQNNFTEFVKDLSEIMEWLLMNTKIH
jgi:hypothetical protein